MDASIIALSHELSRLIGLLTLTVLSFLLAENDLFWFPVPLVPATKTAQVVEASAVEGIAELAECFLQVLVCGFVATEEVLVIAKEKEDENTEKTSEGHDHD